MWIGTCQICEQRQLRWACTYAQSCHLQTQYISCLVTKPTKWLWAQRRLRSAWASAQSDQNLRCPHEESLATHWAHSEDWSESSLGSHVSLLVLSQGGSYGTWGSFRQSCCCVGVLRPFHTFQVILGGQFTYPYCSCASLIGSLPVLIAQVTGNCPSWNSGRERMAVEIISWPNSTKECCRTCGSNPWPSAYQADADTTELPTWRFRQRPRCLA